jgi:hypothetical protein
MSGHINSKEKLLVMRLGWPPVASPGLQIWGWKSHSAVMLPTQYSHIVPVVISGSTQKHAKFQNPQAKMLL